MGVSDQSSKRALKEALTAENRRLKCAQSRIKALRLSLEAFNSAESNGSTFIIRSADNDDEDVNVEDNFNDDDDTDDNAKTNSPDFHKASSATERYGGNAGEANTERCVLICYPSCMYMSVFGWKVITTILIMIRVNHQNDGLDAVSTASERWKALAYWRRYCIRSDRIVRSPE